MVCPILMWFCPEIPVLREQAIIHVDRAWRMSRYLYWVIQKSVARHWFGWERIFTSSQVPTTSRNLNLYLKSWLDLSHSKFPEFHVWFCVQIAFHHLCRMHIQVEQGYLEKSRKTVILRYDLPLLKEGKQCLAHCRRDGSNRCMRTTTVLVHVCTILKKHHLSK